MANEKIYFVRVNVIGELPSGQKQISILATGADGIRFYTDSKHLCSVDDILQAIGAERIVRCENCLYWDRTAPLAYSCRCNFRATENHVEYTKPGEFCSNALVRENENTPAPQWVEEPTDDPNIVIERIG